MKWLDVSIVVLLLLASLLASLGPIKGAANLESIQIFQDGSGIRIVVGNVELYFNATNGGEITEYFDLTVDPLRLRNLVNVEWKPYYNLLPLFTSLFYKPPYPDLVLSTGGDSNARLWLISNTSQYAILQSSSRIMGRAGEVAKDNDGNAIYVNSTWIIRDTGLISVERTFLVSSYATYTSGWRWYPFYVTRTAGSNYNLTFYMFNTTYAYDSVVNPAIYRDNFSLFSLLPNDTSHVFGVALPFSNTSVGGDGTHNILIAYKYDELTNVNQWKSDNYYSQRNNITEAGAVYQFSKATNISTHTYHMIANFTHQPLNRESILSFANYYAQNTSMALLMESSVTANKDLYKPGDYYVFHVSGKSYYDLKDLTAKFVITNSLSQVIYQRTYGPGSIKAGQVFNLTLLAGTVGPNPVPDRYTLLFQIRSSSGIVITSGSKVITVTSS